jgi:hypothetical protein
MAYYIIHQDAWADEDGNYGVGNVIHFQADALTEQQWEVVNTLNGNSRYDYIYAVLNNQDLSEWEN